MVHKSFFLLLITQILLLPQVQAWSLFTALDEFNAHNRRVLLNSFKNTETKSPAAAKATTGVPDLPEEDPMAPYTFANLAGEVPEEITELVTYIKDPAPYQAVGAKMPKGILLYGPPGTGKTSIARAIAGEAEAAFFAASGSEFIEMYVGVGPQRIRELFQKAREAISSGKHQRAIIFIDEIDAIGGKRSSGADGANNEYRTTLNELLNQMDGFARDPAIFVIGATNTPDHLDNALLRPGRFDRLVAISLPNEASRKAIISLYTKKIRSGLSEGMLTTMVTKTAGFSGAELQQLINEAAVAAARSRSPKVNDEHFEQALVKAVEQKYYR